MCVYTPFLEQGGHEDDEGEEPDEDDHSGDRFARVDSAVHPLADDHNKPAKKVKTKIDSFLRSSHQTTMGNA